MSDSNPAILAITADEITIEGKHGGHIVFATFGGPEEPVGVAGSGTFEFEMSAAQVDELQHALVSFSNTGYFNQEI